MNYRKTKQRERILELLQGTKAHPTAEWLYDKLKTEMPDISLGTVYRNLKVLIDQSEIQKLPFGSGFDRFDADMSPHYHLICEQCGSVEDLEIPFYKEINEQAQKSSSFKISGHRIEFYGICDHCQLTYNNNQITN